MNLHGKDIKIFSANANPAVAEHIAKVLGSPMGKCDVSHFSDGEISVSIHESFVDQTYLWCSLSVRRSTTT